MTCSWKTAMMMRAISKQTYNRVHVSGFISLAVFLILECAMVLLVAILFFLSSMQIVTASVTLTVNIVCFIIAFSLFVVGIVGLTTAGALVLKTIRRTSLAVKSTSDQTTHRNPVVVTIGLIAGLLICILFQLIAAAIASAVPIELSGIKVIWHLVNSLGVLIFSIINMLLFSPMFIQTDSVVSQIGSKSSPKSVTLPEQNNSSESPLSPSIFDQSTTISTPVEDSFSPSTNCNNL